MRFLKLLLLTCLLTTFVLVNSVPAAAFGRPHRLSQVNPFYGSVALTGFSFDVDLDSGEETLTMGGLKLTGGYTFNSPWSVEGSIAFAGDDSVSDGTIELDSDLNYYLGVFGRFDAPLDQAERWTFYARAGITHFSIDHEYTDVSTDLDWTDDHTGPAIGFGFQYHVNPVTALFLDYNWEGNVDVDSDDDDIDDDYDVSSINFGVLGRF